MVCFYYGITVAEMCEIGKIFMYITYMHSHSNYVNFCSVY